MNKFLVVSHQLEVENDKCIIDLDNYEKPELENYEVGKTVDSQISSGVICFVYSISPKGTGEVSVW